MRAVSNTSPLSNLPVSGVADTLLLPVQVLLMKNFGWRGTKAAASRRTPRRFAHFHPFGLAAGPWSLGM